MPRICAHIPQDFQIPESQIVHAVEQATGCPATVKHRWVSVEVASRDPLLLSVQEIRRLLEDLGLTVQ